MWIGWQSKARALPIQNSVAEAGYRDMECYLSDGEDLCFHGIISTLTGTQHRHAATLWLYCLLMGSADRTEAGRINRTSEIPAEIWRKTYRGCRGGLKRRRKGDGSRQWRLEEKKEI